MKEKLELLIQQMEKEVAVYVERRKSENDYTVAYHYYNGVIKQLSFDIERLKAISGSNAI